MESMKILAMDRPEGIQLTRNGISVYFHALGKRYVINIKKLVRYLMWRKMFPKLFDNLGSLIYSFTFYHQCEEIAESGVRLGDQHGRILP